MARTHADIATATPADQIFVSASPLASAAVRATAFDGSLSTNLQPPEQWLTKS